MPCLPYPHRTAGAACGHRFGQCVRSVVQNCGGRPVRVTLAMVDWAKRTGSRDLLDEGYTARRSRHNLGLAVDLTLVDPLSGSRLDMGTAFDAFSRRPAPPTRAAAC